MSLVKPQMRRLHQVQIKKNLVGLVIFCTTLAAGIKLLISLPKKRRYDEFYKTYNREEALEQMNASGFMRSSPTTPYLLDD